MEIINGLAEDDDVLEEVKNALNFKNIIGEDLIKYIKEIKIPVFLIWGEDDKIVPAKYLKDIKKLNREVIYKTVPGVGHKLPYEKPEQFFEEIKSLI